MSLSHRCHSAVGWLPNSSARVGVAPGEPASNRHECSRSTLFKESEMKSNFVAAPLALAVALCGSAVLSAQAGEGGGGGPPHKQKNGGSGQPEFLRPGPP